MLGGAKRIAFRKFRKAETDLHELNYLFWECTTRWNLNCLHCGSDCSSDSIHSDMPLEDFLEALDTIEKPAPHSIVALTGGEPLLREDLETCGKEIRKRGMRWGMVTNGHLYDEKRHMALLNAGMGALTISLDGLRESHDWLRNTRNSFSRVDKAIELAAGSDRLSFGVVTCVNRKNFGELSRICEYLTGKGVKAWRLFTITPTGRAKNHPELFLSGPEFRGMLDFTQGNIYRDNFYQIWQERFIPFRNREWTRTGRCADCADYRNCQGNGFHFWHGDKKTVLVCHLSKLARAQEPLHTGQSKDSLGKSCQ